MPFKSATQPALLLPIAVLIGGCIFDDLGFGKVAGASTEATSTTPGSTGDASDASSSGSGTSSSDSTDSTTASTGTDASTTTMADTTAVSVESSSSSGATSSSSSSTEDTGSPYPLECDTAPVLEYACDAAGADELAAKVQSDLTVAPNSSDAVAIDIAQCGDATIAAAGLVVELVLEDSKFCAADFTISCPSGPSFPLISQTSCAACDAGDYTIAFRVTGASDVCTCKPGEICNVYYEKDAVCEYLEACDFSSGDPWVLGITTHADPVTVASVAIRFALAQ